MRKETAPTETEKVMVVCEKRDQDEPRDHEELYAANGDALRGRAILDNGATDSIIGAETLQDLADIYEQMGFRPEAEIEIDRTVHENFVFGSNQSSAALGLSHINSGVCGRQVSIQAHMDMKTTVNFRTGIAGFKAISDEHIKLERTPNHHLLLPVTAFAGNEQVLNAVRNGSCDAEVTELSDGQISNKDLTQTNEGGSAKTSQ